MARLPKSIIKKYGISKKAYAVFRSQRSTTTKRKNKIHRGVKTMARRKHYRKSHKSSSGGFGFGGALKILAGAGIAVVYEVFVSPLIPLDGMIKNIVELVLGLFLMTMKGMPMIVRAGGAAIATINAYQLIFPLLSGVGGTTTGNTSSPVYNGFE